MRSPTLTPQSSENVKRVGTKKKNKYIKTDPMEACFWQKKWRPETQEELYVLTSK